jgi:hypothetical protein
MKIKAVWVGKWERNIFENIYSNWRTCFHFSFNLVYVCLLFCGRAEMPESAGRM